MRDFKEGRINPFLRASAITPHGFRIIQRSSVLDDQCSTRSNEKEGMTSLRGIAVGSRSIHINGVWIYFYTCNNLSDTNHVKISNPQHCIIVDNYR